VTNAAIPATKKQQTPTTQLIMSRKRKKTNATPIKKHAAVIYILSQTHIALNKATKRPGSQKKKKKKTKNKTKKKKRISRVLKNVVLLVRRPRKDPPLDPFRDDGLKPPRRAHNLAPALPHARQTHREPLQHAIRRECEDARG
jgi:hypothetical protein